MNNNQYNDRHYRMMHHLSDLPRRMLLSGVDNVTEFVLYDLCAQDCFNLNKAAYLVDNPDFDCLKGIAGFSREKSKSPHNRWEQPDEFTCYVRDCHFNKQVKSIQTKSKQKDGSTIESLAEFLGLKDYKSCCWQGKHGNHGLFIYEPVEKEEEIPSNYLLSGLCMLSFCPLY